MKQLFIFILLIFMFLSTWILILMDNQINNLRSTLNHIDSMRIASADTILAQINAMKAEQLSRMYKREWKPTIERLGKYEGMINDNKRRK